MRSVSPNRSTHFSIKQEAQASSNTPTGGLEGVRTHAGFPGPTPCSRLPSCSRNQVSSRLEFHDANLSAALKMEALESKHQTSVLRRPRANICLTDGKPRVLPGLWERAQPRREEAERTEPVSPSIFPAPEGPPNLESLHLSRLAFL